ncbi:MAG TPA: hypothetical protein QF626_01170 [Prochlorococcaceae cyanobacterium Fu_MAG_50]|nr:hypothetical protein [Prochlorococcaceae cyanobacterium Fu_MAG_50]
MPASNSPHLLNLQNVIWGSIHSRLLAKPLAAGKATPFWQSHSLLAKPEAITQLL